MCYSRSCSTCALVKRRWMMQHRLSLRFSPLPRPAPWEKCFAPCIPDRDSLLGNNHMGGSEKKERRACIIYLPYLLLFATLVSLLKCPDRDGHGDFIPTPSGHSPHPPTRKSPGGSSRILLTWELSFGLREILEIFSKIFLKLALTDDTLKI